MIPLLAALFSHPRTPSPAESTVESTVTSPGAYVQFRPGDALPVLGPDARIDLGLREAAAELVGQVTRPDARLTPDAVRAALGRAGYPADARFLRIVGGADPPAELLAAIPRGESVDVGWAWRDLPDGRRWWVVGWAPRHLSLDPLPRDLALDRGLAVRVDGAREPRLFVGAPDGGVTEYTLTDGMARWVGDFHVPGEFRLEVVDGDRVELLFSVYVDAAPPPPAPLVGPAPPPDAATAAAYVSAQVAALRSRTGASPLAPLPAFDRLARAHAACLGGTGETLHRSPSCPGVAELAARSFSPRGLLREDVAAADTAAEAWQRLLDSPGHRANLLAPDVTHLAVGAAMGAGPVPRVVIVTELCAFPNGLPAPIPTTK